MKSYLLFLGFFSEDPDVFLDAFDFWNEMSGIAFGDAINVSSNVLPNMHH